MNNEQVNKLIQGIGMMTELWMITYKGFKRQGLNDEESLMHTKLFMSVMLESFIGIDELNNGEEAK